MKNYTDKQRLEAIKTLARQGFHALKNYEKAGCFVFAFEDNGKKLEATICSTDGFISGIAYADKNLTWKGPFSVADKALQSLIQ